MFAIFGERPRVIRTPDTLQILKGSEEEDACGLSVSYWGGGYLWAISVLLRRRILVDYQCPIEEEDTCGLSVSYWGGGYLWAISVLLRRRILVDYHRHKNRWILPWSTWACCCWDSLEGARSCGDRSLGMVGRSPRQGAHTSLTPGQGFRFRV